MLFKKVSYGFEDMDSTMILLQCNQLDSLLDCPNETKRNLVSYGLVRELLQCSARSTTNAKSSIANVWRLSSNLLQSDNENISNLRDFLLKIMMHTIPDKNGLESSSPLPPDEMFGLWSTVAKKLPTKLAVDFCLQLEDCIAAYFNEGNDGHQAWTVYQKICKLSPDTFVDLFMKTLSRRIESIGAGEPSLLSCVLEYDCSNFSCLADFFMKIHSDKVMIKLWTGGQLDHIAITFVLQACKQKSANDIIAGVSFAKAAEIFGKRFLTLLTTQVSDWAF